MLKNITNCNSILYSYKNPFVSTRLIILCLLAGVFFTISSCFTKNEDPYVILISVDGFRHDYIEKFSPQTLSRLADQGARAALIPSFPSKTFPNHYSIVTGLYPANHGLVANSFYDPEAGQEYTTSKRETVEDGKWYGGTPIWVAAHNQGLKTACYYWVGSEAEIKGVRPDYYYLFDGSVSEETRAQQVVDWLKLPPAERPRFITLYFELVDNAGHRFGPDSPQTREAVLKIDRVLKQLTDDIGELNLPVNYVLVSDHGMINVDQENPMDISDVLQSTKMKIVPGDIFLMLHGQDSADAEKTFEILDTLDNDFKIYKEDEISDLTYGYSNSRFGNILLVANAPRVFGLKGTTHSPGAHGYDPRTTPEMAGIFISWGPNVKSGLKPEPFENIHIYPYLADLLKLNIDSVNLDGRAEVLKRLHNTQ